MNFRVNDGPFAGQGRQVRHVAQPRASGSQRELKSNVALRVEDTADAGMFKVSGRGELHLSVLIETMRREGYELCVSQPQVILQTDDERQDARAVRGRGDRPRRGVRRRGHRGARTAASAR